MEIMDTFEQIPASTKRKRASKGGAPLTALQKAQIASIKFNKGLPWSEYGAARIKRGSPWSLEQFGQTYKTASEAQKENRRAMRFTGRGKYSFGKFLRQAEPYADRFLKKGLPTLLGAAASLSGRGIYSGRGAYSANNLIAGGRPSMIVGSNNDETQSVTISHCEYLQDVYGASSANFSVESWNLNPGLMENFPWLAQIASNYEEYEFIQLMFHFKSTVDASAVNNTSGSTGTIIMATNYNATAPNFSNKETMMQYHGSNSGRVTDDHNHGVECDPSKNAGNAQKYVRFLPVQIGQDLKTFDLGKFQLGQVNLPSTFFNQQIGELWVSYTVKLTKPRLVTSVLGNASECRYVSNGGETYLNALGTAPLTMQQNAIPISVSTSSSTFQITFPDFITGVFDIQLFFEGTLAIPATYNAPTLTLSGNCDEYKDILAAAGGSSLDSPTYFAFPESAGVATSIASGIIMVRVNVTPATAGISNQIDINYSTTFGALTTFSQVACVIRMTNPSLAQSTALAIPAFINSSGVVTQPY